MHVVIGLDHNIFIMTRPPPIAMGMLHTAAGAHGDVKPVWKQAWGERGWDALAECMLLRVDLLRE
jgi:hypothetical protein